MVAEGLAMATSNKPLARGESTLRPSGEKPASAISILGEGLLLLLVALRLRPRSHLPQWRKARARLLANWHEAVAEQGYSANSSISSSNRPPPIVSAARSERPNGRNSSGFKVG